MALPKFSVLLSIYEKESKDFLKASLDSIINQTLLPDEIVLIKDGPLPPTLEEVIEKYQNQHSHLMKVVALKKNMGLGLALREGIKHCSYELIARMDTDDIAHKNRFEKQINFMAANPHIDVLGSNIQEFATTPNSNDRSRKVPESHEQIIKFAKWKSPMNHMTVIFKRKSVLDAGNYQHFSGFEDYHLWVRMIMAGNIFHNLQENLIYARIGNDMIGRRHGTIYLNNELSFINWMYSINFINRSEKLKMKLTRSIARLMPKKVLELIYSNLNREQTNNLTT